MGSFEAILNRLEVREDRHVERISVGVRIRRQESEVDRIRLRRVSCERMAGLELFQFIDTNIPSKGDLSTPVLSVFVSNLPGGHKASSQITGVFERKKVEVPFIGRMKTCDPLNFLVEVVVSDLPRPVW